MAEVARQSTERKGLQTLSTNTALRYDSGMEAGKRKKLKKEKKKVDDEITVNSRRRKRIKPMSRQTEQTATPATPAAQAAQATPATQPADKAPDAHLQSDCRTKQDGVETQSHSQQQQLEQQLAEAREIMKAQADIIDHFTAREAELKAREDAVLRREEVLENAENAARTREEAIATESANPATADANAVETAAQPSMQGASSYEVQQYAANDKVFPVQAAVQDAVESVVAQVANECADTETPQIRLCEVTQATVSIDVPLKEDQHTASDADVCEGSANGDESLRMVVCEAANPLKQVADDLSGVPNSDDSLHASIDADDSGVVMLEVADGQRCRTVEPAGTSADLCTEAIQAVDDTNRPQTLCVSELNCESEQESPMKQDVASKHIRDAVSPSDNDVTDCVAQGSLDQPHTAKTSNGYAEDIQMEKLHDINTVEIFSPASLISVDTDDCAEQPSHAEPARNDQPENVAMIEPETEAEVLKNESVTLAQAQLNASDDNMQTVDDTATETLFTLDEFEAEMSRQRALDEVEEQCEGAHGDQALARDQFDPPRRKSLRLQKISQDSSQPSAAGVAVGNAGTESVGDWTAEEGDDFFSPFPDQDMLSQVENNQAITTAGASKTSNTEFQAARRRHSVMPARRGEPQLLPTISSESSTASPKQEQTVLEEAVMRKPANRPKSRASTRRAPSRASTRRKTRKVKFPIRKVVTQTLEATVYDRSSMCPALYSCDVCSRQFLAGLSGFEHYFHCDQCDDFDICTECLETSRKDHYKGSHTFSEVDPERDDEGNDSSD